MKNIVVVGGGTSGYLLLLGLVEKFPDKTIIMIDSSKTETMGVGESVTGHLTGYIEQPKFRLDTLKFYRECDPTAKLGILYKNWYTKNHVYVNPIEDPSFYSSVVYENVLEDYYIERMIKKQPIGLSMIHSHLMKNNKVDVLRDPDGSYDFRFKMSTIHVDAVKLKKYLKDEISLKYNNVTFIDAVVKTFDKDAEGYIKQLVLANGKKLPIDLLFDCTGFKKMFISEMDDFKFKSLSDKLLVNSSVVNVVRKQTHNSPPTNYSLAQAMDYGWMFQIPTAARYGMGYNYNRDMLDDESALNEFQNVLGKKIDNPKFIKYNNGYNEKSWIKNVISIGPSSSFLEPLEATSLHTVVCQSIMLLEELLPFIVDKDSMEVMSKIYNQKNKNMLNDFLDFIMIHYMTQRDDTDFWRNYQKSDIYSDRLLNFIELWKHRIPLTGDFEKTTSEYYLDRTSLILYMPVIDGLNLYNKKAFLNYEHYSNTSELRKKNNENYYALLNDILKYSVSHSEYLAYMRSNQ